MPLHNPNVCMEQQKYLYVNNIIIITFIGISGIYVLKLSRSDALPLSHESPGKQGNTTWIIRRTCDTHMKLAVRPFFTPDPIYQP